MFLETLARFLPLAIARPLKRRFEPLFLKDDFKMSRREEYRLAHSPRFFHTSSPLLGKGIELPDPFWYLYCYREIFVDQIYKFDTNKRAPLIIDCGANIGLSIVYFKYLYPDSKIIAFEPDAQIFRILEKNVNTFQFADVDLYQKAVWSSYVEMLFQPDGSVGGRLTQDSNAYGLTRVTTVRLKDFLTQKTDFLKIDIEGAEFEVIKDCEDNLGLVDHLFVEYHVKPSEKQLLHNMLEIIQRAGFRYHIKDAFPIPHPFIAKDRNSYYDLQLNIFGFRG